MLERWVAFFIIFSYFLRVNAQDAVEVTCHVNGKKSIQCVSEKFLSISIDPAVLLAGVNLSESSLLLAQHLSPAYIRIAGPSTKFIRYFDEGVLLPTDTNSVPVTPATWFAVNEWLRLAGLQPVYGINDVEEQKGLWDPRGALSLLELSDKLNVTGFWQLGFDTSNKSELKYKQDLDLFRSVLDGFPDKNEIWRIVGSDISALPKPESTINELKNILDAVMWEPRRMTQSTFPEKEGATNIIQSQKLSNQNRVKLWTCVPKASNHITFASALLWAEQLGQAAKIGYNVVFRQPRMYELFAPTPVYWLSALHKKLMGTNVLEAKTATNQPGVDVFAHCSRNQNSFIRRGALTLMTVNRNNEGVTIKVKFAVPQADKTMEVQYYILTAPSINSSDIFLNDNLLTSQMLVEKDPFKPKLRRAKTPSYISLTVPPSSVAFFVLPGAKIPVCIEDEVETNMLLEEIEEDQKALLSEEIALKLGPRGSFGGNLVLEEITKQIKKEMESDEQYYQDKLAGKLVETKHESKAETKEDEEVVNRRRKYFIDRAKMSGKRRTTPNFEKKKDDFKKFLLEKSKTAKLEDKPKNTQMELTSGEVEKILRSRAKARASQRNIVFTDTELNALVHKAKKKFYNDKSRKRRGVSELLSNQIEHPDKTQNYKAKCNQSNRIKRAICNQIIFNRIGHPNDVIRYYGDHDEAKNKLEDNKSKITLKNKRDINQIMFHRLTNADNLIQNKEKREEIKQTNRKMPKSKRDIQKKRLSIEARIAEKKYKIRANKKMLKGRMNGKTHKSRDKRDVRMPFRIAGKLILNKQTIKDDVKRSRRGTETFAEAKKKFRIKTQALKDRMKDTLNNIKRSKRNIALNAKGTDYMRISKQAIRGRTNERLNSVRRFRRDINMDMVNEHGKKKSKKPKIVKEATMRRADQTSAEILAELEAEEKAREMEDKVPEMKKEIFAEMADDEGDMFDGPPNRKDSGVFRKNKKDPFAIDIVEPNKANRKSRKHQSKGDELQFLRASEEFTDIEDDYPCIHEFFIGKHEPVQIQKTTKMELGEYTAQKIKAEKKQKPGLWEEAAGFRRRRSIPEDDLKVEGLDVHPDSQDTQEEQQKSYERVQSTGRHFSKRDVNKRSSQESNFKTMYGMPKSEIARHLANLNRIMSFNKINSDVLKRRVGNTAEKDNSDQQELPMMAVEENKRGMLRQLDKLRKKIQRRKNDIDKLLTKEAKKYGEIGEQAGLLGNNLLSQFSRDLGKELSITKDLIKTQIPLEKKMKEYSYKLKEIADRNAKLGVLLTGRSYSTPVTSSEEIDEDIRKLSSYHRSHEENEETSADISNTTEDTNAKVAQDNNNTKVSLLLTRTGAVLQDHTRPEQIHPEAKYRTFSNRIGEGIAEVREPNISTEEEGNERITPIERQRQDITSMEGHEKPMLPVEQFTENHESRARLELDRPLLKRRIENDKEEEREFLRSAKEEENGQEYITRQKQKISIPMVKIANNEKSQPQLGLYNSLLINRMEDTTAKKEQETDISKSTEGQEDGQATSMGQQKQILYKLYENVERHHLPIEYTTKYDIPIELNNQKLQPRLEPNHPLLMTRMGETSNVEQQNEKHDVFLGQAPESQFKNYISVTRDEDLLEEIGRPLTEIPHATMMPIQQQGVLDYSEHNKDLHSQSRVEQSIIDARHPANHTSTEKITHLQNMNPLLEKLAEKEDTMVMHQSTGQFSTTENQSHDNTLMKEYNETLEQQNDPLHLQLGAAQQLHIDTIGKQLNDQLKKLLANHSKHLGPQELINHSSGGMENGQELVIEQSNIPLIDNLGEISLNDYVTAPLGRQYIATADETTFKSSSIETAFVRESPQHPVGKLKNGKSYLSGELMENKQNPTTLKPSVLKNAPEVVNNQDSSEYIVNNILSQIPLTTENTVAAEIDISKKFVESFGAKIEVTTETQENQLQALKRNRRYIIGDKRFGDYRPLSKDLKKWMPSDILSFKRNMTSFKTLKPPPNDYHMFKSALEQNKVRIIRRSTNFGMSDVENRIDKTDFNKEMFNNKARDIFKSSKKFLNNDATKNTIVKMNFRESEENRRNAIGKINKYEQFLSNNAVDMALTKKMKDYVRNQINDHDRNRDNMVKEENSMDHIQMINNVDSDGSKSDDTQRTEKNTAKTKLFERFVANLSGFLTNIGKQVGMYVKKINI